MDIEDHIQVAQVLSRAQLHMDRNDPSAFADLFEDDAVVQIAAREPLKTPESRRALVTTSPRGVHLTGAPVIVLGPDAGRASSQQTFLFRDFATGSFLAGWYEDQFAKREGQWRLVVREINFFEPTTTAVPS